LGRGKAQVEPEKHGLDFSDAHLVYDDPEKCTYRSSHATERRWMDIALVTIEGRVLALVYTERAGDVRVISFRSASREEREQYEKDKK
jgi:uncharacterized DUF497 family protein